MNRASPTRQLGPSSSRSTHSSPARGSSHTNGHLSPSLDRPGGFLASFLSSDRDSEDSHHAALEAAQAEHKRVRESAILAFKLHEQTVERNHLQEKQKLEQERLQNEESLAVETKRLQELKMKAVPKPPSPPSPPSPSPSPLKPVTSSEPLLKSGMNGVNGQLVNPPSAPPSVPQSAPPSGQQPGPQFVPATNLQKPEEQPTQQQNSFVNATPPLLRPPPTQLQAQSQPSAATATPAPDRYLEIHKDLKRLRKLVEDQSKVPGSPLKARVGDMRRDIRKSIGQLTGQKGANTQPIHKILNILREAMTSRLPSVPVDVQPFIREFRQPSSGTVHDDTKLPSLFLYLINIFSKTIISQFVNECGANTKAADPIGIVTASIFSQPDFRWRGGPLIDILMAKFRVICPVLFGFRGSDRTERGRLSIGWRRDGNSWMPEQMHKDRMTGLGAGFASVALRDFSRVQKENPYPPTNYWRAMAFIINSPPNEISDTQYVVLKAMIEGFEKRFLEFYGNASFAALRLALVDFPKKSPTNSPAAGALAVLGDILKRDVGLVLE